MALTKPTVLSAAGTAVGLALVFNPQSQPIISCFGFSVLGAVATFHMIPKMGPLFIKVGLSGKDLLKKEKKVLPETMGAVVGLVYMFCLFFFIPFMFYQYLVTETSGAGNRDEGLEITVDPGDPGTIGRTLTKFPHNKLASYLSALLSLQSMFILGVADDLFDIRWRNKFFLPAIAAIPLMIVYYVDFGVTRIVIPHFIQPLFGNKSIDLGFLYYLYMAAVAIFCPNSINIYAGVNGLEVSQSLVIGLSILANDILYLARPHNLATESHLLSLYLVLPFLGVTCSLLYYNWWPAQAFVGDTYCYLAGMVYAVVGILGHFSKTILLFFLPQIFNFAYSVPQLFKIVECPRHRMPHFNEKTGLLEPSKAHFTKPPHPVVAFVLRTLGKLKLLGVYEEDGKLVAVSNMTLINLALVLGGPMREDKLTTVLLSLQLGVGLGALIARHTIATLVFGYDNI
ncbi:uncharacterized protein SAPINGB_P002090 [Magnusiomyces paraingens]|uniref:UDP-N-acetylglucosamine--dolichyl-phosphate N-acetylglucosaminephosphotransferase n=1 Tax=Magnusiomyces paraingens TaxID=2606893 RepID=A0A5E8BK48_9ASCO|nr:uncharacterized protein SAPINGB_P002090 [Saprochaete ingens]VVT49073.1 unnamed protein product [Saprochaete ingens]